MCRFKQFFLLVLVFSSFILIVGCAASPTSVGFTDEENEYVTEPESVIIETVVATKTDAELEEKDEPDQVEPVPEQRETFSSSKGYWRAAIAYLQQGNEDDARWALEKSLALNPKNKIARDLMYQLDVDAINELGIKYFEYKVQYGDSLSKLSKKYLNDALKFYLLAKYNDISNPGRLVVGQVIHIPGDKNSFVVEEQTSKVSEVSSTQYIKVEDSVPAVTMKTESQSAEDLLLADAEEMLAAGENLSTIDLIENTNIDISAYPKLSQILVQAYYQEAKQLKQKDQLIESKLLLIRAAELEPDNIQVNMMLIDMNEVDQADSLYQKSLKALAENKPKVAYELIERALAIEPGYLPALKTRKEIKEKLTAYYYKQALMAQRKHELDRAIKLWDEVLILNQENDNAKLYRAKAISLKSKLEKFVSSR